MKKQHIKSIAASVFAATILCGSIASASNVNILWYTGGTETSGPGTYEANINALAAQEQNPGFNVSGSINTWNITYWSGGAMPVGAYNVLVAASKEGSWYTYPNYSALTSSVTASSFGSRVLVSGQDADWHVQNYPGPGSFNGPAGFLIDSINWAASGTGMGGVFLDTGVESSLFSGFTEASSANNTVIIPGAYAAYPINVGLTSAGISNSNTASHTSFYSVDPTQWTSINVGGDGSSVTLVSAQEAGGGTSVPDAGTTSSLLGLAMLGLAAVRRKLSLS